jgi:hypothetical protein
MGFGVGSEAIGVGGTSAGAELFFRRKKTPPAMTTIPTKAANANGPAETLRSDEGLVE